MKKLLLGVFAITLLITAEVSACSNIHVISMSKVADKGYAVVCMDGMSLFCSKRKAGYWQCGTHSKKYYPRTNLAASICKVATRHCAYRIKHRVLQGK